MFTKKQIKDYLTSGKPKDTCPGCGSANKGNDYEEMMGQHPGYLEWEAECYDCKEVWIEVYKLVNIKQGKK